MIVVAVQGPPLNSFLVGLEAAPLGRKLISCHLANVSAFMYIMLEYVRFR